VLTIVSQQLVSTGLTMLTIVSQQLVSTGLTMFTIVSQQLLSTGMTVLTIVSQQLVSTGQTVLTIVSQQLVCTGLKCAGFLFLFSCIRTHSKGGIFKYFNETSACTKDGAFIYLQINHRICKLHSSSWN
jgi:hypothetical protein